MLVQGQGRVELGSSILQQLLVPKPGKLRKNVTETGRFFETVPRQGR